MENIENKTPLHIINKGLDQDGLGDTKEIEKENNELNELQEKTKMIHLKVEEKLKEEEKSQEKIEHELEKKSEESKEKEVEELKEKVEESSEKIKVEIGDELDSELEQKLKEQDEIELLKDLEGTDFLEEVFVENLEEEDEEQEEIEEEEKEVKSKDQLTLMGLECIKSSEKKEVILENPPLKVLTFMDIEAKRVEGLKFPISYGEEGKLPKKDTVSITGVSLASLGQYLYNFKLVKEKGIGKKKVYLKNRECKISFDGTVYSNGEIGMVKLLSYSISRDLHLKRALEVYTFIQKLLSGNEVTVEGDNLNFTFIAPERYENLKVLKIVDILYKYYSISKEMDLNQSEKIEFILKNASEINDLASIMRGRTLETMVKLEGDYISELENASSIKIILSQTLRIKKMQLTYQKDIEILENVLETEDDTKKVSTSWKKAYITYKKVLD